MLRFTYSHISHIGNGLNKWFPHLLFKALPPGSVNAVRFSDLKTLRVSLNECYSFNIFSGQLFRERLSQLDGFSKVCTRIDCIALSQDCLPKLLHNRCDFLLSRSFLGGKKFSEVMFRHFKNISRIAFGRVSSSQTIQYVSPGLLN